MVAPLLKRAPAAERLAALLSPDRLAWAVWVRWLVIGGFLLLTVVAHAFGLFASISPCVTVALVGGALNGVNDWCVRRRRYLFAVTIVEVPLDQLFITYLVVQTGGVQSPFLMLYVVQVLATAMLVSTLVAAVSASWAIVLWLAAVSLQAAGYIETPPLFVAAAHPSNLIYHATWAAFLCYCLALLVYLGGYIGGRLRSSERDLAERNRQLHETLSSLRAAYDRLARTEAHLVQSEKMRSLGQLVAGVAHELNNPISFVSGNVEHLRTYMNRLRQALDAYASAALPESERRRLDRVRQELRVDEVLADLPGLLDDCEEGARRTKHIVNELRTFSRSGERESFRRTDINRGIDSTLGLLADRLKHHITVHRDFGDLPEVECLPGQLNQVVMNLVVNAVDAIGSRPGNIWISTRMGTDGANDDPSQPRVTVAIRDDGVGMIPEVRAKVFEPFFTTKQMGEGTGLGLAVSYGIVERHHGTLTVESAPDAGATFTISLPVNQTVGMQ